MRRMGRRQMMKVIQSLRPLDRALTGILGQLWFPKRDTLSPFSLWSIFPDFPPFESMNIFLIPFGLFCHPSVALAVADTPNLCLNLNCMTNLLLKASDPDGQRKYLSSKTRTSPPVSVAPKRRTLSPWCVPPQPRDYVFLIALSKVPGFACPLCQFPPLHRHHCQRLPPSPDLIQRQVFVGTTSHLFNTETTTAHNMETYCPVHLSIIVSVPLCRSVRKDTWRLETRA